MLLLGFVCPLIRRVGFSYPTRKAPYKFEMADSKLETDRIRILHHPVGSLKQWEFWGSKHKSFVSVFRVFFFAIFLENRLIIMRASPLSLSLSLSFSPSPPPFPTSKLKSVRTKKKNQRFAQINPLRFLLELEFTEKWTWWIVIYHNFSWFIYICIYS